MSPIMKEFLTTDIGLMSMAVVAISAAIISYLGYLFATNSKR